MEIIKQLKDNKLARGVITASKILITIILIIFVLIVYLQRFSNNKISFFNYRMFTVVSGSMEPKYKIGDVLIAKKIPSKDIKIGDAISYLGQQGDFKNKVITHEVVNIEKDEEGHYKFYTKGKTSIVIDPVISEDQVYGVIIYKSLILSTIYKIISTNLGFFLCIMLPLFIVIGSEILAMLLDREKRKREA